MIKRILIIAALWFAAGTAYADDWTYTLRPGDELWSVAKTYCGSARLADEIARYNNIADPALVRAGTRIRIPTGWLAFAPTHAEIIGMAGTVQYLADVSANTHPAAAAHGQKIAMGTTLITAEGSALVQFADGSRLTIQPHSRVLFNKLTAFGPAGMVDTHLRFAYGNGTSNVQPQNRGDRFRIETPEGVAAVRGTEFRVGYTAADKLATTETLEGEVAFIASATTTTLPDGFGVAASPRGLVKEPLLPAPDVRDAEVYTTNDTLNWQPVADAHHYSVTWARQSSPDVTLRQTRHEQTHAVVDLPPDSYAARIRAVSDSGINGNDATHLFRVLSTPPAIDQLAASIVSPVSLQWQPTSTERSSYRVELTDLSTMQRTEHETRELGLQQALMPGRYQWRVRDQQSAWSTAQAFTVLPPPPANLTTRRQGKTLTISWDAVAIADGYRLQIVQDNGENIEVSTDATQAIIEVPDYGTHTVKVASQYQALHSTETTTDVTVSRNPWWLMVFVVLALTL